MIDKNAFGLKDAGFKVVNPAKPACCRRSTARRSAARRGVPGLGTAPDEHPLQDEVPDRRRRFFGPDFGKATVLTNTRKGYAQECSNVGQLLKNLSFTSTWKAPDGQRPGRQDEARRRRQGLAEGEPASSTPGWPA
jgi:glycine betaine/proline transport system substrate-binding protein